MRKTAGDLRRHLQGGEELGWRFRALDEHGREVKDVHWVDAEEGTFGQLVRDDDGKIQKDPDDFRRAWVLVRYGKLRFERIK